MKTELTIEESAKLVELGVYPEWAKPIVERGGTPVIKFEDILGLMPKEIWAEDLLESLLIFWNDKQKGWSAHYPFVGAPKIAEPELIDALYKLLVWSIESKVYEQREL